jgi:Na+-translocating ferredoxin:NAD+ oxidoreductase RnfG subunit
VYLTDEQRDRTAKLAEVEVESKIARPYVAKKDGVVVGTAYVDVHRVRSLKESVMVVVDPKGKIARVELLSFGEPLEYVPKADWWGQFVGKGLDDELALKRGVRGITGATLSARAAVDAARRVLALHRVLGESKK